MKIKPHMELFKYKQKDVESPVWASAPSKAPRPAPMGGANERNQGQKGKADDPGRKLTQVARHTSRDTKKHSTTEHTTEPRHKTRGVARTFASTTGPCRTPHTPTSRHQQGGGGRFSSFTGPLAHSPNQETRAQAQNTHTPHTTPQSATAGRERGTTTTDQTSNVGTIAHKGNNREERGKRRKAQVHPTSHEEHQQHHRAHML